MAGNILDDPARLKAEREAADREYNEALTRLDHAIQQLPHFPHPPPGPDEHQITPLNTLWQITISPARGWRRGWVDGIRRAVAPLFEQQRAFNSAVVDHINRNVAVDRETRASIESTLTVLRDTIADLIQFQSVLIRFLQQITPYVDTRDRDVAGLLRGLSGAINAVADEVMKRAESVAARDVRRDAQLQGLQQQVAALSQQIAQIQQALQGARRQT